MEFKDFQASGYLQDLKALALNSQDGFKRTPSQENLKLMKYQTEKYNTVLFLELELWLRNGEPG